MISIGLKIQFKARLLCPALPIGNATWAFLLFPKEESAKLPRRGRTTVVGTMNRQAFQATLEPDGQLSHWLQVSQALRQAASADVGDLVSLNLVPVDSEPEPTLPPDLQNALSAATAARHTWDGTTALARLDWIHWIESAKQLKTRAKRIRGACDKLGSGQARVCCFDPSGFYSKALKAPVTRRLADESAGTA